MKRVLLIDDDSEILNNLEESFSENSISVIKCNDRTEALSAINDNIPFDAVILDWYFVLDNDSSISIEILRQLNNKHFKPVFIYTGHLTDFENANKEDIEFPQNLLSAYDKTTDFNGLRDRVQQLLTENYSLQLASVYRESIKKELENVLFEVNRLQNVDLARVLNKIYGNGANVDWSNDIILNLLHRYLISDATFINGVIQILQAANNVNAGASPEDRKKIANKILYFKSQTDLIRNGDVAVVKRKSDNTIVNYGIVVTPDCDLEQGGTQYIDLIELVPFNDAKLALNADNQRKIKSYNHDSFYLFQSLQIEATFQDFVAVLKSRLILRETSDAYHINYPKASKRLLYTQDFIFNGEVVTATLLCSKVNPYKAEFLQKLNSSNTRVGIPDIKDLL